MAGAGVCVALIGLVAAVVSIQLPWMRSGWRIAFILNGVAGVAISGVIAYLAGGVALGIFLDEPMHSPSPAIIPIVETLVDYGVGACVLWGFIFASWFALRRDKYFVEGL